MQILPNAYQKPNIYTDQLAYLLTPEENLVLDRAIREILGWRDTIAARKAPLALSIFVDGKFDKGGNRVAWGCGLSVNAVRKALDALHTYRLLVRDGESTNEGQPYWLQDDEKGIDWAGLEQRRAEVDAANARRTHKAIAAATKKRQGVMSDDRPSRGIVPREGVMSDDTQGVMSDDNMENHRKPQKTIEEKSGELRSRPPDFFPEQFSLSIRAIQERKFNRAEWTAILEAEQARGDAARKSLVAFVESKLSLNQHPAIQAYREETHYYPPGEWKERIVAAVGGNGGVTQWRAVVAAYVGLGWNPRNVKGMLEYFARDEIPTTHSETRSTTKAPVPRTAADEALASTIEERLKRLTKEKPSWMQ